MTIELYGVSYAEANTFFYEENNLPELLEDEFSIEDGGFVDAEGGDMRRYVIIEYSGDDSDVEQELFSMVEELSDEYNGEIMDYEKGGSMDGWKFKPSDEGWLEGVGYIKILQLLPIDEAYPKERYFYRKMDNNKVAWSHKDKFEKSDDFAFTLREDLDEDYIKGMGYAKGGMVDENKAHYYQSEGTIWVDSNFVNFSKGNIPNSELKHYGYGDFYLDTPKGKISFIVVYKNIDGFVGRSHKLKASDELGSELFDAMGDKVQEIRAYAEGGMVDYFENYEQLPEKVQELYFSWGKRLESGAEYEDLKQMLSEFEANGYTFDYGLDAEPYDLRPIGEYGEGGEIDELADELANATDELANQKRSDKDPNSPFILSLERKIKDLKEELSYHYEEDDYAEGGGLMSKEIDDDTWNRLKREAKERMSKPENVDLGDDLDMET